jgi:hypothetical protein
VFASSILAWYVCVRLEVWGFAPSLRSDISSRARGHRACGDAARDLLPWAPSPIGGHARGGARVLLRACSTPGPSGPYPFKRKR